MSNLLPYLPATVVAAVLLFIAKEVIEAVRRYRADARKVQALKALLARECELNLWPIKSLRDIFKNVPKLDDENPEILVTIEQRPSGRAIARIRSYDGGSGSTRTVPDVHRDLMSKHIFEVAALDRKLFEVFEPAYDSLATLEHVRESLVHIHESEEEADNPDLLRGLADYGLGELKKVEAALGALYLHCTGKNLETHRLR